MLHASASASSAGSGFSKATALPQVLAVFGQPKEPDTKPALGQIRSHSRSQSASGGSPPLPTKHCNSYFSPLVFTLKAGSSRTDIIGSFPGCRQAAGVPSSLASETTTPQPPLANKPSRFPAARRRRRDLQLFQDLGGISGEQRGAT